MKKLLFPLLLFCTATMARSQDSLLYVIQQIVKEDSLIRDEMRFNTDGLFLPVRGLIQTFTHRSFNELPGPFRYNNHRWEDYGVALTPLAATWIMKACGVESRSTTRRMAISNGLALGLTVGLSQTLRWSVREVRPDERGSSSFPSFHSALAFMGATVLSREYGHISPWITIGGYTAATGTQLLRVGHNAHWMNDVFMGAGIGVVSTHLAYFLTDKLLGPKGINSRTLYPRRNGEDADSDGIDTKWNTGKGAFRLTSGTETNGRTLDVADLVDGLPADGRLEGSKLRSSASITAGFEAEWFLTDNLFLSAIGRYTMSQVKLQIPSAALTAWGEQMHLYHGNIAAGWTMPLFPLKGMVGDIYFGVRTLWGVRYNEGITFHRVASGRQVGESLLDIRPQLRPTGGAGIIIDMLQRNNQTVGFTIDYLHTFGTSLLSNRWVIASSWKAKF